MRRSILTKNTDLR